MTYASPLFFSTYGAERSVHSFGACRAVESYNARKGKMGWTVYGPSLTTLGWVPTLEGARRLCSKVAP